MSQPKPPLPGPLMRVPRALDIDITTRCNLDCSYCSHFDSPGDVRDIPTEEWLSFFEELGRCTVMNVTLAGGEPFLRKDFMSLLQGVVDNRMRFSILSNGTLINDEAASFIAATRRCNSIQISLDGSDAYTHDSCRGKGSFRKAIDGIRILKRHRIRLTVRVTIHRHNVRQLESISALLLEDLRLPRFSTNEASHLGMCRSHVDDVQLTVQEKMAAMNTLLRLNKKYNGRITATAGPLANAKTWLKMERARRENQPFRRNSGYLSGCGRMWRKLAVRADGVIIPCSHLGHLELGRVNQSRLKEIWQNHETMGRLRNRQAISLTRFKECRSCDYHPYCTGNCPAIAYSVTGDVDCPSPDSCLKRFLENGGKLPDESLL